MAVALGGFVYLWNAASGDIVQLCQTETPDCYVGAVSWIKEGNYIALGDSNGAVQVMIYSHCLINKDQGPSYLQCTHVYSCT